MPGIFDISMILSDNTPTYPGDPLTHVEKLATIKDSGYDLSRITVGVHIGTHIDAPAHYFEGKDNIFDIPLDVLIGKALVLEFDSVDYITASDLKGLDIKDHTRILFKTTNSNIVNLGKFSEEFVYLDESAADYLVEKGVRLIGFDYYTIDKYNSDFPSHKKLLGNDVIIIEGLNLSNIETGEFELLALPLKMMTEAAPARVILRQFIRGNIP